MQSLRSSSEDSLLPKEIKPGLIKEAIDLASRNGRPVVLSMNAKKVAMGLKGDKGDIDLWGYEPNGSFETKVAQLQEDFKTVEQAVETLNACDSDSEDISLLPADKKAHLVEHSKVLIMAITAQLKAVRHLILRQKQAMLKFEQLSLTEEGAQKYQYSLSATKATIYQAKRFVQKALDLNRVLIFHASHATNGYHSGVQSPLQSPFRWKCQAAGGTWEGSSMYFHVTFQGLFCSKTLIADGTMKPAVSFLQHIMIRCIIYGDVLRNCGHSRW